MDVLLQQSAFHFEDLVLAGGGIGSVEVVQEEDFHESAR